MQPNFGSNLEDDSTIPLATAGEKMTPARVDAPPERAPASAPYQGPRVRIVLEDNDNIPPTGQFFGHNGRGFILRSGEEADVPPELIGILNDAVWDAPIVDSQTQQIIGYRKRLRFPYRILGTVAAVSPAAVAA